MSRHLDIQAVVAVDTSIVKDIAGSGQKVLYYAYLQGHHKFEITRPEYDHILGYLNDKNALEESEVKGRLFTLGYLEHYNKGKEDGPRATTAKST